MEINEDKLYFLDFETGGLESDYNGVCSCTLKKFNSNFLQNFLFYPQNAVYECQAFKINHLSIEELYAQGKSRKELIKTIGNIAVMDGKQNYIIFCGWNIGFDIKFLLKIYGDKNIKLPCPVVALDLKEVAADNLSNLKSHRLTIVYQYFFDDFEEEKAHTSEYDTLMVEKLYDKFKENGWI